MSDPYARVYYSIIDDPKFKEVYNDDALLAAWLRLLLTADAMWPASAPLPRTIKRLSLLRLNTCGLVDLVPPESYRIHGLDAERGPRRDAARDAAGKRWSAPRNAPALIRAMPPVDAPRNAPALDPAMRPPMLAEPSLAEPSRANARANGAMDDSDEFEALQYLARHQTHIGSPGNGLHRKLIELVGRHGINRVIGTFDRIGEGHNLDARGYIFGASNVLDPIPSGRDEARSERADAEQARIDRETQRTQEYLQGLQQQGDA